MAARRQMRQLENLSLQIRGIAKGRVFMDSAETGGMPLFCPAPAEKSIAIKPVL